MNCPHCQTLLKSKDAQVSSEKHGGQVITVKMYCMTCVRFVLQGTVENFEHCVTGADPSLYERAQRRPRGRPAVQEHRDAF